MKKFLFLVIFIALACASCGPSKISVINLNPAPVSLINDQISPRTACLVVNPDRVPTEIPVLVDGKHRGGTLIDVQEFVKRDLKKAFQNYFKKVIVVNPGDPMPTEPHIVIDVRIDRVEIVISRRQFQGSMVLNTGYGAMTWSLAMRPSESKDYIYSYAGQCNGAAATKPDFLFRSMLESAIASMLKGYTDKKVQQEIMNLP